MEAIKAESWPDTLIQSVTEGVVTVDDLGCITSFNSGAERITGWLAADVLHTPADEVFRLPEGQGLFTDCLPAAGGRCQMTVLDRNHKPVTLAITITRLRLPDSRAETALVLRDITEEEAAQRLRSSFVASVTHEFRTPLSALNASVEFLLDEFDHLSRGEIHELLTSVHLSVTGLQTMIDNLLESSNIEAGRFTIRPQPIELEEVLAEASRIMAPLLKRRQQHLHVEQPDDLPLVLGDGVRLSQVLVNLLSNASKFGPVGQTIDLCLDQVGGQKVRVAVYDRGPGIPPAEQADLFCRFLRHSGSQDKAQVGIGLGLSVAKAIVDEHGGTVGVEQRSGGGSIFWFTIPVARSRS